MLNRRPFTEAVSDIDQFLRATMGNTATLIDVRTTATHPNEYVILWAYDNERYDDEVRYQTNTVVIKDDDDDGDTHMYWGHYRMSEVEARIDFHNRVPHYLAPIAVVD